MKFEKKKKEINAIIIPHLCDESSVGLATKLLRILSLGGIDKVRNHLVANPIFSRIIENRLASLIHQTRFHNAYP